MKRTLVVGIIALFAVIGLSFTGCAGLAKPQTQTLDNTIPLEEQAQIRINKSLYSARIDGQPYKGNRVLNIPAGTHTFTFDYSFSDGYTIYSANNLNHTDTFEAGRYYELMPQSEKDKVWIVTSHEGYNEFKKPGPNETLVVLRRKGGGILFGAGNLGEIKVTVDGKETYRTWDSQTNAILLSAGEHQLKIGNQGSAYLTINAEGGTRRYFMVSRSSSLVVKIKEITK